MAAFLVSAVVAKPPSGPCYIKCVNGAGYRCCIVNGQEVYTYDPKIDCIRPR